MLPELLFKLHIELTSTQKNWKFLQVEKLTKNVLCGINRKLGIRVQKHGQLEEMTGFKFYHELLMEVVKKWYKIEGVVISYLSVLEIICGE